VVGNICPSREIVYIHEISKKKSFLMLATQHACVTPTVDTTTDDANLSALTVQALLVELLNCTPSSKSPGNNGDSFLSDNSSEDNLYNPAGRVNREPKKRSSGKIRKERKRKLYQYLLKNAKTVRDNQTSFKILAQNSNPKSRRTSYNKWIKQIKK